MMLFNNLFKWPNAETLNEQTLHDALEHTMQPLIEFFKWGAWQGHRKQNGMLRQIAITAPH